MEIKMKGMAKKRAGRDNASAHEASIVTLKKVRAILAASRRPASSDGEFGVSPPFSRRGELGDRFGRGEARIFCINDA
jgi:hypothetical protein